jgi:hypothetical protein
MFIVTDSVRMFMKSRMWFVRKVDTRPVQVAPTDFNRLRRIILRLLRVPPTLRR